MFLTEALNYNTDEEILVEAVEPTSEGYSFEYGGLERVQDLMESDTTAINMAENVEEVRVCNMLHEANMRMRNGDVSGHEMLIESAEELSEATIKSVFDAIIGAIKKAWARVKEVMSTVALYFKKIGSNKAFLTSAEKFISSPNFNPAGLEFEGYNYNFERFDALKSYKDMIKEVNSKFSSVEDVKTGLKAEDAKEFVKEANSELEKVTSSEAFDDYVNVGFGCKAKDVKKTLYKTLRGSDEKVKLSFNKELCKKAINGYDEASAKIKSMSAKLDSMYVDAIKQVEVAKKANIALDKDNNFKPRQTFLKSVYSKKASIFKKLLDVSQSTCSIYISVLKEERAQAKSIIMKAISQSKKNGKEAGKEVSPVSESAFDLLVSKFQ